jgi:hypothetical protein
MVLFSKLASLNNYNRFNFKSQITIVYVYYIFNIFSSSPNLLWFCQNYLTKSLCLYYLPQHFQYFFVKIAATPSACRNKVKVGERCPDPLAKEVSLASLYFFVEKSVLVFLVFQLPILFFYSYCCCNCIFSAVRNCNHKCYSTVSLTKFFT